MKGRIGFHSTSVLGGIATLGEALAPTICHDEASFPQQEPRRRNFRSCPQFRLAMCEAASRATCACANGLVQLGARPQFRLAMCKAAGRATYAYAAQVVPEGLHNMFAETCYAP